MPGNLYPSGHVVDVADGVFVTAADLGEHPPAAVEGERVAMALTGQRTGGVSDVVFLDQSAGEVEGERAGVALLVLPNVVRMPVG